MPDIFTHLFTHLLAVDRFTILTVAGLAFAAGYLVKQMLSASLAVLFVPGFIAGALASIYIFQEYGILIGPDNDTNAVLASGAGIIVALLILLGLVRFVLSLRKVRHPVTR